MGLPEFMYGTAWKEERTAALVALALEAGFRAIDTANQRKHYVEAAVGEGLARAGIARDELFLQTKFTYQRGQDHRLPYDPASALPEQVTQSFASSLDHLRTDYLDSFVLHGPASATSWSNADRSVWEAMQALHRDGKVRFLGVSNIARGQLETLIDEAAIKPAFVQNRCYARTGWDREVRELCRRANITYQGFSLLTANRTELAMPQVAALAERKGLTVAQLVFAFAHAVGMLPLTGTSDPAHMAEDLASIAVALEPDEIRFIEGLADS